MEEDVRPWCEADLKQQLNYLSECGILSRHILWRLPYQTVIALIHASVIPSTVWKRDTFWNDLFEKRYSSTHGLGDASSSSNPSWEWDTAFSSPQLDFQRTGFGHRDFERLSCDSARSDDDSFVLFSIPPGVYRLRREGVHFSPLTSRLRSCCLRIHGSRVIPINVLQDPLQQPRYGPDQNFEHLFVIDRFSTCEYYGDGSGVTFIQRLLRPSRSQKEEAHRRLSWETWLQRGTLSSREYYAQGKNVVQPPERFFQLISGLACWWPSHSGFDYTQSRSVDVAHSPFKRALDCTNCGTGIFTIFSDVAPGEYELRMRLRLECPEQFAYIHVPFYRLSPRRGRHPPKGLPPTSTTSFSNPRSEELMQQWVACQVERSYFFGATFEEPTKLRYRTYEYCGEPLGHGDADENQEMIGPAAEVHVGDCIWTGASVASGQCKMRGTTMSKMRHLDEDELLPQAFGFHNVVIKSDLFAEVAIGKIGIPEGCDLQVGFIPVAESLPPRGALALLEEKDFDPALFLDALSSNLFATAQTNFLLDYFKLEKCS